MMITIYVSCRHDGNMHRYHLIPRLSCQGWKTRAQLMAMHNDEQTVNRIIDMKTRNSEFKEHPDSPGDANATLFYVLLDMERVDEDEHEDRVDLSVSGEATGEQVLNMFDDD